MTPCNNGMLPRLTKSTTSGKLSERLTEKIEDVLPGRATSRKRSIGPSRQSSSANESKPEHKALNNEEAGPQQPKLFGGNDGPECRESRARSAKPSLEQLRSGKKPPPGLT